MCSFERDYIVEGLKGQLCTTLESLVVFVLRRAFHAVLHESPATGKVRSCDCQARLGGIPEVMEKLAGEMMHARGQKQRQK